MVGAKMKKTALKKDFKMEIKKTMNRFLSILFIVALGVAFFSGIQSAAPDMRYTADEYFDQHHLADIKVISTLGLIEENIQTMQEISGVERVYAGYMTDVLCGEENSQKVLHVESIFEEINKLDVEEGRLPQKEGECFLDTDFAADNNYHIGDTLIFSEGKKEETFLKTTKYTITGIGSASTYISFGRGSSTLGTGTVAGFAYILPENFDSEIYTQAYITVEGAKELTAYTEEYDQCVEEVKKVLDEQTEIMAKDRYDSILSEARGSLANANRSLSSGKRDLKSGVEDARKELADAKLDMIEGEKEIWDAQQEIASGKEQLLSGQPQIVTAQKKLKDSQEQIASGEEQLNAGWAQYNQSKAEMDEAQATLGWLDELIAQWMATDEQIWQAEQLRVTINETLPVLEQSLAQLNAQQAEIDAGKAEIENGKNEILRSAEQIKASQKELADGSEEIRQAKIQLLEGQKEYFDGKDDAVKEILDAQKEIDDGQKEITDAQKELDDLEEPNVYVMDRDAAFQDYSSCGENADRIRNIGKVFPVIFFLVAALVSLTTMARMVEEERTQIGTMKALGYGKGSIMAKYMGYAFIATALGSVIGFLIGEKILPFIIIYAYRIMFPHMTGMVIPYNMEYAVIASGAALFCTMGATIASCYKELADTPAVLMRPPAPKEGKRVWLEYLPFIWKHLSFTWKSTIRNLMRYKKRFFMTILGIGGCMALLLVGFGLRDSILDIARIQYKELQLYDATAIFEDSSTKEDRIKVMEQMEQNSKIDGYGEVLMKQTKLRDTKKDQEVYLFIMEDISEMERFVKLRDRKTKEKYVLDDDGIILTEKISKLLGVSEGDTVVIGDDDLGDIEVTISHITENYMSHYLYMTPSLYEKLYGQEPEYNSILFQSVEKDQATLDRIGEELLKNEKVVNLSYTGSLEKRVDDMLGSLDIVIFVLIISAGMLAFVVLYNLNNININERKRELATIKVLGFYDGEVSAYVYRENILLTIIGTGVGVLFGIFLHRYIIVTVEIDLCMFGRNIDWPSYLYSILFTFGFSFIVNVFMHFKLKKIDMVESLKSVE